MLEEVYNVNQDNCFGVILKRLVTRGRASLQRTKEVKDQNNLNMNLTFCHIELKTNSQKINKINNNNS